MYFVTMTDKFMSGWGMAEGRTNKLVIECTTYPEAALIAKNAKRRGEMRRINIRGTRPHYDARTTLTTWKAFADMGGMWKE